jgi:hemolysin D
MLANSLSPLRRRESAVGGSVPAFESATAEVLAQPERLPERATLYALTALIVVIVVFCCVAKIDRIVQAPGRLLPIAGTITVQPLDKAIINKVLVAVGDVVKKGQVLATCDPTFAKADLTQQQQKIASLQAQLTRMQAEDAGQPLPSQGKTSYYDVLQASIWEKRRTEYQAGVKDFDQRISAMRSTVDGLRRSIPDLQARLEIAGKLKTMNADLVKDGYVSQAEDLAAQDQYVQAQSQLLQGTTSLDSNEHELQSTQQLRQAFIDKWHEDNLANLAKVKDDLDAALQDAQKVQKVSDLVDLRSPADAIVVKVPNLSSGAIASEAQPLFSLVPVNAPLEIAVQIAAKDVGFVRVGDKVLIKFDAYKFLEHGTGTGVVKTISEESFSEVNTQDTVSTGGGGIEPHEPFFAARIKIAAIKLHDLPPDFRISPGMTIQSDIVVGRRTIMWYLLGGALRSGAEAMQEP